MGTLGPQSPCSQSHEPAQMARGSRADTRNRTQGRLGFRRTQGGDRGAAASPSPLEAASPPTPSTSAPDPESARDEHEDEDEDEVPRARLQKLIGDVVGRHIMVPFDHWDYGDEHAEEEPREAVSLRITAWDGEGNVFKVGSLLPSLHLCYRSLFSFNALLAFACQGLEDEDDTEHESSAEEVLRFTARSGITDEPAVARLRCKRTRDSIEEVRTRLSALLLAGA